MKIPKTLKIGGHIYEVIMRDREKEETTTGNPKYIGKCPICGYPCYEGLHHDCSTAPKIENANSSNWREEIKIKLSPQKK